MPSDESLHSLPERPAETTSLDLADERRRLIESLCELPHNGDVVTWQRRLADAVISAERGHLSDARELKRHRHLLRVIGDGLVHTLLPSHTIRTLSRSPGRPAHLSSQGEDFEFVFNRARKLQATGCIPILSDLTTLIGVGDIVALTPHGDVAIAECKNRQAPTTQPSGRLARQRERGERAEEYLATSRLEEDGHIRMAFSATLPDPDYDLMRRLLDACASSTSGVSVHAFAERDLVIAAVDTADPHEVTDAMRVALSSEASRPFGVAFYDELIESASHRRPSPSSWPLPASVRWRLLEGDIHVIRVADLSDLSAELDEPYAGVRLLPRKGLHGYEVVVEGTGYDEFVLTSELTEMCVWNPIPVEAVRTALIEQTKQAIEDLKSRPGDEWPGATAEGDRVVYATLYQDRDE